MVPWFHDHDHGH